MTKHTAPLYGTDLAHVHVEGYGFHWEQAANAILEWFSDSGVSPGETVVDLGCGGGQWLRRLNDAGYVTYGIDASAAMIQIAEHTSPRTEFLCGSFDVTPIPGCHAVTSLGEPLNYLNSGPAMRRTMRNVYAALHPGGVFIFDVRHPAKERVPARLHHSESNGWFLHARIEEDYQKGTLTRSITTFRRLNDGKYRRDHETHRLKVFSRADVAGWLRRIGFRVRTKRAYGEYQLGPRQSVFICRKPASSK